MLIAIGSTSVFLLIVYMGRTSVVYLITNFYLPSSYSSFLYHGPIAPSGSRPPHYRGFMITLRHATVGKTPLDKWSARRRDLYLTTSNTQKNIHASGGIRPYNPSKLEAADQSLRSFGHWDRPNSSLVFKIKAKSLWRSRKPLSSVSNKKITSPNVPKNISFNNSTWKFFFYQKRNKENIEFMCHCFVLFNFRLLRLFSSDGIFVTREYGTLV